MAGRHTARQMYGMGRREGVREFFPSLRVGWGLPWSGGGEDSAVAVGEFAAEG